MIKDNQEYNENTKPNSAFEDELRNKLPEFFNRNGFDLEKFQEALREHNVNEFSEGYQLSFIGKDYARKQAGDLPTTVIVPDNNHNQKEENRKSKNLFFTGDNLEVLRHLRNVYSNKIDVIYIDPPYNTGNGDFVYPDKFDYSNEQLEEIFGMSDKDIEKLNHLKESKSHSAWLTFMYPRLWLAKQLLTNDGVIFISIDDNEQANLKLLMDDIFGENNFIGNFIVNSTPNARDYGHIGKMHDFILFYAANINKTVTNLLPDKNRKFKYLDDKGGFNIHPLYNSNEKFDINNRPNLFYPFYLDPYSKNNNGFYNISLAKNKKYSIEVYPPKSKKNNVQFVWRWGKEKVLKNINNDIVGYEVDGKYKIVQKMRNNEKLIRSLLVDKEFSNRRGTYEVENIMEGKLFDFPKPIMLLKKLLQISSMRDSLILDFFAGSATTADAVMQLNAEDGGNRQFIMVQLPELTYKINEKTGEKEPTKGGKVAFEAGYMSIDEISRERIRRASKKIKEENPDLSDDFDGGFKHYRVVNPNITTLNEIDTFDPNQYELVNDMITPFSGEQLGIPGNASGEDTILTTWLVQDGYSFNNISLKEYNFLGYKAYGVEDTRLYLINGSWTTEQTEMLVNQLGNHIVNFKSIVVYGYSFNMPDLRELELALSQLNTKVELIKRY